MSTTTTNPIDFSSLPQDQQQQLQQLQLQFQEHQQQQQKAAAEKEKQAAEQQAQQIQQQQYHHGYAAAPVYDPSQVQAVYDPSLVQPAYDPSQVQAYDQSYYAGYYQYQDPNQVQNPQQEQYQQQHYAYYPPDYANVYQPQPQAPPQPQPHQQHYPMPESAQIHQPAVHEQPPPHPPPQLDQQQYSQPELAAIHQPSLAAIHQPPPAAIHQLALAVIHQPAPVPAVEFSRPVVEPPSVGLGHVQVQHQKNAYYPQQVGPGGDQNLGSSAVPQGLNPAAAAAVAALSQLTQFAGTMDAAERAMAGLPERQWYGGAGGYGPGGFPGQFMGHGPMHHSGEPMRPPQAGQSPFRGRGGGRSGPFRGSRGGSGPPSRGRGRGRGTGGGPHRRQGGGGSSSSHQEQQPSAADVAESSEEEPEPPPPANTQAGPTLVLRCETCNADCNSLEMLEKHNNGKRHKKNLQKLEELKSEVPETAQDGARKCPEVPETVTDDESKQQRQGMKRNMRGGGFGGEKRARTFDGPARRQIEPHKPKVVIPLICELCNVKCDTREVFNCHLSGKKHISKLKRFEDHQSMYGPSGVQALYPPNPISQNYAQGPPQAYHAPPPPQNNYPLQFAGQNSAHGPISAIQMYGGSGVNPPSDI